MLGRQAGQGVGEADLAGWLNLEFLQQGSLFIFPAVALPEALVVADELGGGQRALHGKFDFTLLQLGAEEGAQAQFLPKVFDEIGHAQLSGWANRDRDGMVIAL